MSYCKVSLGLNPDFENWVDRLNYIPTEILFDSMLENTENWYIFSNKESRKKWLREEENEKQKYRFWSFPDYYLNNWLNKEENLEFMLNLGFDVYRYGKDIYYFGFNIFGLSFVEQYKRYWIPLYERLFDVKIVTLKKFND